MSTRDAGADHASEATLALAEIYVILRAAAKRGAHVGEPERPEHLESVAQDALPQQEHGAPSQSGP
jgi:hypothetical protein